MILDFTKLHTVLERIAAALENGAKMAPQAPTTEPKTRGRPAKGEVNGVAVSPEQAAAAAATAQSASAVTTATSASAQTTAPTNDLPPVEKVATLQQVADAIIELANSYSRDQAVAILTKYGVKKVPELKPEQFNAVLADVAKAKNPVTAASGLV